tara:strand:+ start:4548 stop:6086 length:1539 start_codon:yes stop_codon:yes gene_type:complete
MMTSERENLHKKLDELVETYKENEYVYGRLVNYIDKILPTYLDTAQKTQAEREKRKIDLNNASDAFTNTFMLKNKFYFSPHNELFMIYNGIHFSGYSEDNIQHMVLTQISANSNLRPWKYKINNKIIRHIKDNSPLTAIPESETIQYVINLFYPAIFSSRNHVKYFLTVVGDSLRNLKNDLVYIASPNMKTIVHEISIQIYTHLGLSNALSCIKFKHYEHDYSLSRLLFIDETRKPFLIPDGMSKHIVDVLCVASHYSIRYKCADDFLRQCTETALVEHCLYLQCKTPETIVETFIKECVQSCPNTSINTKNMVFIWKKYLETINIPNVIFIDSLISIFKRKFPSYDEESDAFVGVTSMRLPNVSLFLDFWEKNMMEEPDETEIEIDEISTLFQKWSCKKLSGVGDAFLIELIRHFYPDIIIIHDKYVMNVKCKLWDKHQDVVNALDLLKAGIVDNEPISLYAAYEGYASQFNSSALVVSKQYFEKTAKDYLGNYLDDDGIISSQWVNYYNS